MHRTKIALLFRVLYFGLMTSAGVPPHAQAASQADVEIYVITDIHYIAQSLHDDGKAFRRFVYEGDGKNTELIHEILEAFRYELERAKPDVLLVTGDLTLNGEKASHAALASYFRGIEALGVKVFVLPGNHDIQNPWARRFTGDRQYPTESVTPEEFGSLYRAFGFDEAISRDGDSLSYVVEPAPGLRVFMLDSCFYDDNGRLGYPEAGGGFSDATLAWIGANLASARAAGAQAIVAMHHNAVDHNPFISEGYTIYDAEALLDLFSESDIAFALSGHVHVQDIGEASTPSGPFRDIATNSLSVFPHNFGRLSYSPRRRLFGYRASPVGVESWARDRKISDTRLADFEEYSERFFRDRAAFMVDRMLARMDPPLPRERKAAMRELFETLNARFFAGKAFLNEFDVARSDAYRDIVDRDYGFLSAYARSIVEDPSPTNDSLEIRF